MNVTAYLYLTFSICCVYSCSPHVKEEKLPDVHNVRQYKVAEKHVIYQYYEEYGFTDVCKHMRLCAIADSMQIDKQWKKLPLTAPDLQKINQIGNKIDKVKSDSISVVYMHKQFFQDISIVSEEYVKDSLPFQKISLRNGYYKLHDETLEVFIPQTKILYVEHYACDGN
jgi:hypothetical protein